MTEVRGFLAIVSAVVFCPCHLPILAAAVAGTALGTAITDNYDLLLLATALYFTIALFVGVRWMTQTGSACESCEPEPAGRASTNASIGQVRAAPSRIAGDPAPKADTATARTP